MPLLPMTRRLLLACALALGVSMAAPLTAYAADSTGGKPWVVFEGKTGPGKGKHVVFVTGDDEYFSEEGMPVMARILAEHHGFTCTVLFAINKDTGVIDTNTKDNIPGLETLATADLMVMFTRFRALPDDQMKMIADYLDSGKAVMGLRTATHAFQLKDGAYQKYSYNSNDLTFQQGFGKQVLGETWAGHHGGHGKQSTRGLLAPEAAGNPILRGLKDGDIWGTTDVYGVKLPLVDATPLIMGQVLSGMKPDDPPAPAAEDPKSKQLIDKNHPMMPVAWTRTYTGPSGKPSRVFTTTMGGAMSGSHDWDSEGLRRLLVNATYWCVGLEGQIPEKATVDVVAGPTFKRGVKPQDVR
ncbi:MAG TPA: ThuA domain-containing protein [Planctomycetota bacterium]|nr:ThuA domain-containing protein [Planctomycetota bacterium]